MADLKFVDNSTAADYCPNPNGDFLTNFLEAFSAMDAKICSEARNAHIYTNEKYTELLGKISAIETVEGLTEKLTRFQAFVDAVDSDADNVIDALAGITAIAERAEKLALEAKEGVAVNAEAIATINSDFSAYKTEVTSQIAGLTTRVNSVQSATESNFALIQANDVKIKDTNLKVATNIGDIASLKARLETYEQDGVNNQEMVCASLKAFTSMSGSMLTSVKAMAAQACELELPKS